ncbi:MAG: hypothetical protein OXE50_08715 [Chloroflexi bacterium]|nr:hypothetical protein [Chloroflexota bacterium]
MRYEEQLNVYAPAGTRERIRAVAEPAGKKQSTWLREVVLEALRIAEQAAKED